MTHDRLLRFPMLQEMLGLSRSSIERLVASGKLPAPIKLGRRAVAWWQSEVFEYMNSLPRMASAYQRKAATIRNGVLQPHKAKVVVEDSVLQMVRTRWPDSDDDVVMVRTKPAGYSKPEMR